MPSLISGDDRLQFSSSYSRTKLIVDSIDGEGVWHLARSNTFIDQYKFDLAYSFAELWQVGISVPVMLKINPNAQASGLADISANLGYEVLPEFDYSLYRPKGILYLQLTLPTGRNINEDESADQLQNYGRGLWAFSAGLLLTKSLGPFDAFANIEGHRSFARSFYSSGLEKKLSAGNGFSANLGLGYNTTSWRFGPVLSYRYEDPVTVSADIQSTGLLERVTSIGAAVAYLVNDELSISSVYSDQTLIGSAANTSLGQTLSLQLQKRWPR